MLPGLDRRGARGRGWIGRVDGATGDPRLHVHREGSGPPLVLLPGLASTVAEFRAVVPRLVDRYEVLAIDLPGQGRSPALAVRPGVPALTDALERELDRQQVGRAHVLGVSLGGRLGLELARRQRARSVVAIAPTGPLTPLGRGYQAAALAAARIAFDMLAPAADRLMRPAVVRTAALGLLRARGWRTPPDEAAALVRAFAEAEDFWRLLRHAVLPEATVDYRSVDCPVLVAQGTHDVLALSQPAWLALLVPGARFRVLPFAGHSPVADVPSHVVRLVDEAAAAAGS